MGHNVNFFLLVKLIIETMISQSMCPARLVSLRTLPLSWFEHSGALDFDLTPVDHRTSATLCHAWPGKKHALVRSYHTSFTGSMSTSPTKLCRAGEEVLTDLTPIAFVGRATLRHDGWKIDVRPRRKRTQHLTPGSTSTTSIALVLVVETNLTGL